MTTTTETVTERAERIYGAVAARRGGRRVLERQLAGIEHALRFRQPAEIRAELEQTAAVLRGLLR